MTELFHYPPDLFNLMVDGIPLLFKSKKALLLFFQGAGVLASDLTELSRVVARDPGSILMRDITRTVLTKLNERGDEALRQRREILKQISEFESFSTCYPDNELKARGFVAEVRRIVNVKDSFTRMNMERQKETEQRRAEHERKLEAIAKRRRDMASSKDELYALFREKDPHKRGKALEGALNGLFRASDILVAESFTLTGDDGAGVMEQVDGVVGIDGAYYLVEMKWWNHPLGPGDVSQHLLRIYNRHQARGIIISASGFTEAARTTCREALMRTVVVCCDLAEIVRQLETDEGIVELLKMKIRAAIVEKDPYRKV